MSEVKTLVTLVLGGFFDHNELGDIDILYEAPACEALQRELVVSIEDVHVELVSRIDYDAAQSELSALREELAKIRKGLSYIDNLLRQTDRCLLSEKQRNNALGRALSGLLFEFDDGVNGGREEPIPSLDYARSLVNAIKFKPTESGASE